MPLAASNCDEISLWKIKKRKKSYRGCGPWLYIIFSYFITPLTIYFFSPPMKILSFYNRTIIILLLLLFFNGIRLIFQINKMCANSNNNNCGQCARFLLLLHKQILMLFTGVYRRIHTISGFELTFYDDFNRIISQLRFVAFFSSSFILLICFIMNHSGKVLIVTKTYSTYITNCIRATSSTILSPLCLCIVA